MKAYLVLDFAITDLAGFRRYIDEIPAHIARHGGRYIVRGAPPTVSKLVLVEGCT
jgi:uncharacterized protein (DUF1330 family)